MNGVGRITEASLVNRRALNQALLQAGRLTPHAKLPPGVYVRALRSALRMSQAQLSRRSGIPRPHITRVEAGKIDPRLSTLRRLLDAMFCDLVVLPLARLHPSEIVAQRRLERAFGYRWRLWDEFRLFSPSSS